MVRPKLNRGGFASPSDPTFFRHNNSRGSSCLCPFLVDFNEGLVDDIADVEIVGLAFLDTAEIGIDLIECKGHTHLDQIIVKFIFQLELEFG